MKHGIKKSRLRGGSKQRVCERRLLKLFNLNEIRNVHLHGKHKLVTMHRARFPPLECHDRDCSKYLLLMESTRARARAIRIGFTTFD